MSYVDGFVIAVPTANKEAYLAHVQEAIGFFKEFGAKRLVECWEGDVPDGKLTDFRRAVKGEEGERVFSRIRMALDRGSQRHHEENDEEPRRLPMKMPFVASA